MSLLTFPHEIQEAKGPKECKQGRQLSVKDASSSNPLFYLELPQIPGPRCLIPLVIYTSAKFVYNCCAVPLPPPPSINSHKYTHAYLKWGLGNSFLSPKHQRFSCMLTERQAEAPASSFNHWADDHCTCRTAEWMHSSSTSVVVCTGNALHLTAFSSATTGRFVQTAGRERLVLGCPSCTWEKELLKSLHCSASP